MTRAHRTLFGGSHAWPEFKRVDDTVRGGASKSSWSVAEGNVASFSGHLDITALGGAGFASQAASFDPPLSLSPRRHSGLALTIKSPRNVEKHVATAFVLVLKNEKAARRPDGRRESVLSFEYAFDTRDIPSTDDSENVTLVAAWSDFKATYRGRPDKEAPPLDPSTIHELSFMCRSNFGQRHGNFELEIVSLSAVPSNARAHFDSSSARGISWWASVQQLIASCWTWLARLWRGDDGALRLP